MLGCRVPSNLEKNLKINNVYRDITLPFLFKSQTFQSAMYTFNNYLSLKKLRNPSNMGNIKLLAKHLKCLTVIANFIICSNLIRNIKHIKLM